MICGRHEESFVDTQPQHASSLIIYRSNGKLVNDVIKQKSHANAAEDQFGHEASVLGIQLLMEVRYLNVYVATVSFHIAKELPRRTSRITIAQELTLSSLTPPSLRCSPRIQSPPAISRFPSGTIARISTDPPFVPR